MDWHSIGTQRDRKTNHKNMLRLKISTIQLPIRRPFSWRAWAILILLYVLGNLAGIPLLREQGFATEPAWFWLLMTGINAVIIGLGLLLASRTGLGAPLLEGLLERGERKGWGRSVVGTAMLTAIIGGLVVLWLQVPAQAPESYPALWKLVLASAKAGIVEEIFARLFLVTLIAWIGGRFSRGQDGRPTDKVYWIAILFTSLYFGWEHLEDRLSIPEIETLTLVQIMLANTAFGVVFGWQFWKLGLGCAMLSHFLVDALTSAVLVPAFYSQDVLVWAVVGVGLLALAGISLLALRQPA